MVFTCLGDTCDDGNLWPDPPSNHIHTLSAALNEASFSMKISLLTKLTNFFRSIGYRHPDWYSDWPSTSQKSKLKSKKKKYISSFLCQSYPILIAFYTAIKRGGAKTWTRNGHAAGKIMFCLWSGAEGIGEKSGSLKGEGRGTKRTICLFPELD